MSENRDLFGKIDALFEKRAPDVLLDKGLAHEDFPVLTDVVAAKDEADAHARVMERRSIERRAQERRLGDRRQRENWGQTPISPVEHINQAQASMEKTGSDPNFHADFEQLVTAVEQRLSDLFIRQQLRTEEAVRRAIRDELAKAGKPL